MKTQGLRISDTNDHVVSVKLPDILTEIRNGTDFYWSILYIESVGDLGEGTSIVDFENNINKSEKGLFITWDDLNLLSHKFFQVIDIIILGCKDKNLLHRYESDQDMYESSDIFINMFDSSFWEIFSKDEDLIYQLAAKFKKIEFLKSDFLNKTAIE